MKRVLSAFHYFEPNKCGFIYQQHQTQDGKPSSGEAEKLIAAFYCPDCEEALSQAQVTFADAEEMGEGEEQAGLAAAEEWCIVFP
jgi:rubredoxin